MALHDLETKHDGLRVPVLARRINIQHPGRLSPRARRMAQLAPDADTNAFPAVVSRAAAPLRVVTP